MSEVETEDAEGGKGGILKILLIVVVVLVWSPGVSLAPYFSLDFLTQSQLMKTPK